MGEKARQLSNRLGRKGVRFNVAEKLHIDPAVLRRLAVQHRQVGDDTKEWAKPPEDWLKAFPDTYGSIASPVYGALENYYQARQQAGIALAEQHYRTADNLDAAADEYERADRDSMVAIGRAGGDTGGTGMSALGLPVDTRPIAGTPDSVAPVPSRGDSASGTTVGVGSVPTGSATPVVPATTALDQPTSSSVSGRDVPVGAADMARSAPILATQGDSTHNSTPAGGTSAFADNVPPLLPTPFAAAVAAATNRESGPGHVVNEAVNEDLVIARTLLAAVLGAMDEPIIGLTWAVSVMRGPSGIGLFLTSNEGRGWLPAGLYLPREVSTPWLWDEMLESGRTDPWEGVADPARVLAEFALAWGPGTESTLTALVSSGAIDSSLRTQLPDTAVEGMVPPAYDVDLRIASAGTADRLALAASLSTLESSGAIADSAILGHRVQLAEQAHSEVGRAISSPVEAAGVRALRGRILTLVHAGQQVPAQLWQELRDADDLLAAGMLSRRVDAGRVDLGQLRVEDQSEALRAMVFERRCTELTLLLADQPTRQSLRDALYAHEQIVRHPLFTALPLSLETTAAEESSTTTAPTGVAPPAIVAGPPSGVTVTSFDDRVSG
ncbi:type VII secretion target [Nocardia sp. NPDC058058]|uniref:type VII secretion target n=1 Tax=Nocardia sp. NPDC058058 TaxID=3346317 RepID=UPI0036DCD35F